LAVGAACVFIGWRQTKDKRARKQIVVTQTLHWMAFLIAMNIVLWPSVNTFLNGPATGLALMLLLAREHSSPAFMSRSHRNSRGALALTVPAIAWLKKVGAADRAHWAGDWRTGGPFPASVDQ